MGKTPDMPTPERRAAPVTPESDAVKAAGQLQLDELRKKQGRGSTFFTNPAMRTGFAGSGTGQEYGKTTGSV